MENQKHPPHKAAVNLQVKKAPHSEPDGRNECIGWMSLTQLNQQVKNSENLSNEICCDCVCISWFPGLPLSCLHIVQRALIHLTVKDNLQPEIWQHHREHPPGVPLYSFICFLVTKSFYSKCVGTVTAEGTICVHFKIPKSKSITAITSADICSKTSPSESVSVMLHQ